MNTTRLTNDQKITVAYMHLVRGITQQDLAAMYNVNNGRISEAVTAVRSAFRMANNGC